MLQEVPPFHSPARVAGVRRGREEDEAIHGKKLKHSLTMVPLALNPEDFGFSITVGGGLGIIKTREESPKKCGRPCVCRNKKQLFKGETSNSKETQVSPSAEETSGE